MKLDQNTQIMSMRNQKKKKKRKLGIEQKVDNRPQLNDHGKEEEVIRPDLYRSSGVLSIELFNQHHIHDDLQLSH